MDAGVIGFIIFILALAIVVYLRKDKIERHGIILMTRTKRFRKGIKNNALKYKKFWTIYFNIGVIVSFFAMGFGIWYLIKNALVIASGISSMGFALVLPWPTSSLSFHPGVLLIPIWYWLIAIVVLLIPHEFSHAITFAINKIRIKYLGLILLLFIPGAFAEPDEKQLKKASKWAQLQVFCAGSFSNIVTAVIFIFILNIFLVGAYNPAGIYYSYPLTQINKTTILEMNNLTGGMVELQTKNNTYLLTEYLLQEQENRSGLIVFEDWPAARNNLSGTIKQINNFIIYSPEDVSNALSYCRPYETIYILTNEKGYNITLAENNGKSFLGITTNYNSVVDFISPMNYRHYEPKIAGFEGLGKFLLILISFIIAVCFGVAIVNILPIKPLDGGLVLETLTNKKFTNFVSLIVFILIIYNFVGPFI